MPGKKNRFGSVAVEDKKQSTNRFGSTLAEPTPTETVKKKEPTQGSVQPSLPDTPLLRSLTQNQAPRTEMTAPLQPSGQGSANGSNQNLKTNTPLEQQFQKAANMLPNGMGVNSSTPENITNQQGGIVSMQGNNYTLSALPKKNQLATPVGNDEFNARFTEGRLRDVQEAMDTELSYAKTEEQRNQIKARYEKEIKSLSSQLSAPKNQTGTSIAKKISTAVPVTKEMPDPRLATQVSDASGGLGITNESLPYSSVIQEKKAQENEAKIQQANEIDIEAIKANPNYTKEMVQNIENTIARINMPLNNLDQFEKAKEIDSEVSRLEKQMETEAQTMDRINNAVAEGRSVADLNYDVKKEKKDEVLEYIQNDEIRGATKEVSDKIFALRDFMSFLSSKGLEATGPNGEKRNGAPHISFDKDGNVVLNGFDNDSQKQFYTDRLIRLMKEVEDSKSKLYQYNQDQVLSNQIERNDLSTKIKALENRLNGLDKNSSQYKELSKDLDAKKVMLSGYDKEISRLKNTGNGVIASNPKEVAKTIISGGTPSLKLAFSSLPENLTPKEKFDLGYERLLEIVKKQEQEIGAGKGEAFLRGIKDMTTGLSPKELEYQKNKMLLGTMTPIWLINETGVTKESENFVYSLMHNLSTWVFPNTSAQRSQTAISQEIMSGDNLAKLNVSAEDVNTEIKGDLEKRAEGPEGVWNQEFLGGMTGTMAGIVIELSGAKKVLTAAKALGGANFVSKLNTAYEVGLESSKTAKFFMPILKEAINAEAAGKIFQGAEGELNFESFALGGTASKLVGSFFSAIPKNKIGEAVYSVFGNQAPRVKALIDGLGNKTAGGVGEVAEEFTQELTQIYNDNLRERGFWEEVEARFGDQDERAKFIVGSFLMGSVMHSAVSERAKHELELMPEERRAVIEQIISESLAEKAEVENFVKNEVTEEAEKVEAVKAVDEDATTDVIEEELSKTEEVEAGEQVSEVKTEPVTTETKTEKKYRTGVPSATGRVDGEIKSETNIDSESTQSNISKNGTTDQNNTKVTSDTPVIGKDKAKEVKGSRRDSKAKRAKAVEATTPRGLVLQHFINGGKIHSSALEEQFGSKETPGRQAKKASEEKHGRIGLLDNKNGKTLNDLAHQLWEDNKEMFPGVDSQTYVAEIMNVLSDYQGTSQMIEEMLLSDPNSDENAQAEADYYESTYGPESIGNEDILATAESMFEQLTPEQQQQYIEDFDGAVADFEAQYKTFEESDTVSERKTEPAPEVEVKKEKIKEATSALSDKIRSMKASIDLSSLSSSPKPLFDAAWNTALEAVASTIDAGGTVAQAVVNGVEAIKNTNWYKNLSDEGKTKAEAFAERDLTVAADQSKADADTKADSPKSEPIAGEKKKKKRSFAKQVKSNESDASKEVKDGITEEGEFYDAIPNEVSVKEANARIEKNGVEATVLEVIDFKNSLSPRARVTLGVQLIKILDEQGRNGNTKSFTLAGHLVDEMSIFATKLGQGVQAFSLWNRLSADGIIHNYVRNQTNAKKEIRKRNSGTYSRTKQTVAATKKSSAKKATQNVFTKSKAKVKNITAFNLSKSDIEKRKKEAREKYKNSKGSTLTSGGLNSEAIEALVEYGAMVFADGVRTFKEWVSEMKSVFDDVSDGDLENIWESESVFENKTLKDLSEVGQLKDVVSDQLEKSNNTNDLAQVIADTFGIPQEVALGLAKELTKEFDRINKAAIKKQLKKDLPSGVVKTFSGKLDKKTEKLIDDITEGNLTESEIDNALDEYFGIKPLTDEQRAVIEKMAKDRDNLPDGMLQDNATKDLLTYIRKLNGIPTSEVLWSLWYSSILSGPETQVLNIAANTLNIGMESFVELIQKAIIDKDPKALAGYFSGMMKGFVEGYDEAGQILNSGQSARKLSKKLESKDALEATIFKGGKLNPVNYAKYVSRFMFAIDSAAYMTVKGARANVLARELAQEEGLSGKKLNKRVSEILNNSTSVKNDADIQAKKDIEALEQSGKKMTSATKRRMIRLRSAEIISQKLPESIDETASSFAAKTTFNYQTEGILGVFARAMQDVSAKFWPFRLVVPFTGIVANVLNQQIDYTPYGYLRATGRNFGKKLDSNTSAKDVREKQRLLIKATMGTMVMTGIYMLAKMYEDDDDPYFSISGKGPSDFNKKSQLYNEGWKPHHIKIGNVEVSYQYSPFGLALASIGNYLDGEKYKEKKETSAPAELWQFVSLSGKSALDMSFLTGLSSLFTFLSSDTDSEKSSENALKFLGKTGTSFIPNAIKQVEKKFNPTIYDTKDWKAAILADIPFVRGMTGLKPKLNALGESVEKTGNRFVTISNPTKEWEFMAKHKIFFPGVSGETKNVYGEEMTHEEMYEYVKKAGEITKQRLGDMIPSLDEYFKDLDTKEKQKFIAKIVAQARVEAKYYVAYEKK